MSKVAVKKQQMFVVLAYNHLSVRTGRVFLELFRKKEDALMWMDKIEQQGFQSSLQRKWVNV